MQQKLVQQAKTLQILTMLIVAALCHLTFTVNAQTDKVVYLDQKWFNRGPAINLVKTTAGDYWQAIDNDGRLLVDQSIISDKRNHRFIFDSITECFGDYYMAINLGNHGYDWCCISEGKKFMTGEELSAMNGGGLFRTFGYYFDHDAVRGDSGMAFFPEADIAIACGISIWDDRTFGLLSFNKGAKPAEFTENDDVAVPIQTPKGRGVRSRDLPDRVFLDADKLGFWYVGTKPADKSGGVAKLAVVHAIPGSAPDRSRTLNLSKTIVIGDAAEECFEAAVLCDQELYMVLATQNPEIGGVNPERRLLRINYKTGKIKETKISFKRYIADLRIAAFGEYIAVQDWNELKIYNRNTFKLKWQKKSSEFADARKEAYRISRVCANADGSGLALAMSTAYSRPDEPTLVMELDQLGNIEKKWQLKAGSVDSLKSTPDGGVLLFSSDYTAKLGGSADVLKNEQAASKATAANFTANAPKESVATPGKATFVPTPLDQRHKIWFDSPAKGFGGQSLPLGNGHLGAMLTGGTDKAVYHCSVDSMWQGNLERMGQYQAFGEITFALGHDPKKATDYRRELDLRTGLHTVTYRYNGINYKREAFCSYPTGLLVIRFTADKPAAHTGLLELSAMHESKFIKSKEGIEFFGKLGNGRKFASVMKIRTSGGRVLPEAGEDDVRTLKYRRYTATMPFNSVKIDGCDSVTVYLAADTNYSFDHANKYIGADPSEKIAPRIANIEKMSFEQMQAESAADVSRLFDRCTIDLATSTPDSELLPIDKRRKAYRNSNADVGLQVLVFDATRYMMIACSRPGSLPANLQGIWNNSNWPDWTCDYHADINLQMNYWFVEPANLAECAKPLFDYIESQIPNRRKVSKQIYGEDVRGWSVHYMNGIYGAGGWKNFPAGSAWYAWHFAEHFKFNQDQAFLTEHTYPVLKELSEHWQDLLVERPDGKLTTPKGMSPEHKPQQYGISQDLQIVQNLFTDYTRAAKRLNKDADFTQQVRSMSDRLVKPQIGRWGQLQEWETDRDSRYCTHRHIQHLFAAFPGSQISAAKTPELAEAAVKSLEARGVGSTGWSRVWRINIFARLQRPELAYRQLSAIPWFGTWGGLHDHLMWEGKKQIDAPCGYASGVCEVLLQSHEPLDQSDSSYLVHLLPALPKEWPAGKVKGLRARGGFEVDMEWEDGKLAQAVIRGVSNSDDNCTVMYNGKTMKFKIAKGKSKILKPF